MSTSDLFVTLGGKTAAYPEQRKVARLVVVPFVPFVSLRLSVQASSIISSFFRYSSLGDFEMELPELNRGRVSPACTSFFQQNGDLVSFNNFQSKTGNL